MTQEYQLRMVSAADGDEIILTIYTANSDEEAKLEADRLALLVREATGRFCFCHLMVSKWIQ